jgi:two-component system, NarL family, sensor histidine kinase DesK
MQPATEPATDRLPLIDTPDGAAARPRYRGGVSAAAPFRWRQRTSDGPYDALRARTMSTVAAALFTLSMVPAWIDALAHVAADWYGLAVVVCVVYGLGSIVAVPLARHLVLPAQIAVCLALLGLGLLFVAMSGPTNSWFLLSVLGIIATLMPNAVTVLVTTGTVAGLLALAFVDGTVSEQFPNIVLIVAVTTAAALIVNLIELNGDLKEARGRLAVLAVAEERERIARDLHDILGHSLTTVALKAGLARRILESGDPAASMVQMRDVERLVQQSLNDLRATVSDYKEITLATELAVAASVLRAAGAVADLPTATDTVEPHLQGVFGFVLREAVTNVIRHGRAERVVVRLTPTSITIANDGPSGVRTGNGNGLRGLEERMAAVGGTVEAGPGPHDGFVVRAEADVDPAPRTGTSTGTDGTRS